MLERGRTLTWQPIAPIPPSLQVRRSPKLKALASQWAVERDNLKARGDEAAFLGRLKDRMAIETGILEGLYTLDRGVTETVIAEGIGSAVIPHGSTDRNPDLVAAILRDQRDAIDFVFDLVKGDRPMSQSVIRELHEMLTRHQPTTSAMDQFGQVREVTLRRGDWKTMPNNPTRPDGTMHAYAPPEHVQSEIDRLLQLYHQYVGIEVAPEILAAWFHHRFAQIHPFQDGNGRVARLLASIVFIRAGWFPLVVLRDDRTTYLDALEKADAGDLGPLVKLFDRWQSRAFVLALGAVERPAAVRELHLDEVLAGVADRYAATPPSESPERLEELADVVAEIALRVFEATAERMRAQLAEPLPDLWVTAEKNSQDKDQQYKGPRIELAKSNGFYADFTRASRWARIRMRPNRQADVATILASSTALGRSAGSLAVTCGLVISERDPDSEAVRPLTKPVALEPFVATVQDLSSDQARTDLETRLTEWLEHRALVALTEWQRS